MLSAILLAAGAAGLLGLLPFDPVAQEPAAALQVPSPVHWLGTDQFGRDIFSRVVTGLGNSLVIAITAVVMSAIGGTSIGILAGYFGGFVDRVAGGVANVLFAIPSLLLALIFASVLNRNWFTVALAIAMVDLPIFTRVARGPVLSLREADFIRAARTSGQSGIVTVVRHIVPNVSTLIVVQASLALSWALLTEASLSYLGLGAPPPAPSLGSMVYEAQNLAVVAPWALAAPGVVLVAAIITMNVVGDSVRKRFELGGGAQ